VRQARRQLRPFDLKAYDRFSFQEKLLMGTGAFGLMALLAPRRFGNEPFKTRRDFIDAAVRLATELHKIFHPRPYQDPRPLTRYLNRQSLRRH
jgi:hypothetical protein